MDRTEVDPAPTPHGVRHPFRAPIAVAVVGVASITGYVGWRTIDEMRDARDRQVTCRITADGVAVRQATGTDLAHADRADIGTTFRTDSGCAPGDQPVTD